MAYFGKKLRHTLMPQELISLGDGVNRYNGPFKTKKSEAYTSLNTCSNNFPALSVREGMAVDYTAVTGPINAIGIRNNEEVHILDGTIWKRWDASLTPPAWVNVATGLTSTPSKIFDFVRETDRLTILVNGTNRKYYDGTDVGDLWEVREGTTTAYEWNEPVVINNKLYGRISSYDEWMLMLGGATGGTFDLGITGDMETLNHGDSAATIDTALETIYGAGNVTVTAINTYNSGTLKSTWKSFRIRFKVGEDGSGLIASFTSLTNTETPATLTRTSSYNANYLKLAIYDIEGDSWSLSSEATLDANASDNRIRDMIVYGNSIFARVLVFDDPDYLTQVLKYNTANDTWSTVTPPSALGNSWIAQWAVVGDYILAVYDASLSGDAYMLKYDIQADSWEELTTGEERSWYSAIGYDGKLYAFGTGYEGIYDPEEEEWDDFKLTLPDSEYLYRFKPMLVLGTNIYARVDNSLRNEVSADKKVLVYDTETNTWNTSSTITDLENGALYVSEYDNVILSRGSGNKVLWYFTTLDVYGDDDLFKAPETNLYTSDDYRLFALDETKLKCTDIAIPTEWVYGDSDSITITSMVGEGTAITWYKNMVICWSEQSMHILLGDSTDNFTWSEVIKSGCISARGHCVNEGVLYFADYNTVKTFTGGITREISQKVRNYLENINYTYKRKICMGENGKFIYISFPYLTSTTNNYTLVYDTQFNTWYPWNKGFNEFVKMGEYLYAIDSTTVWKLNSGTTDNSTDITWLHETGAWNEGVLRQQKAISDLYILVDVPSGSTLTVHYSTSVDGTDDWVLLYTFTASATEQNVRAQVPTSCLQPINWYRLQFSGTGPCTIHYLEPHIRIKAR